MSSQEKAGNNKIRDPIKETFNTETHEQLRIIEYYSMAFYLFLIKNVREKSFKRKISNAFITTILVKIKWNFEILGLFLMLFML